jgi:hypothetical protein
MDKAFTAEMEPLVFAVYARKIVRHGNELKFEYRIVVDGSNPLDLKWEAVTRHSHYVANRTER